MKYPFKITLNNHLRALQIKDNVQIGHYFVFVKQQTTTGKRRFQRLISIEKQIKNNVLPLVDKPVQLDGVTITPEPRLIDPIGCVVADRDLYRAEQDTVHLFIAFPTPPKDLRLAIDCNGAFFTELLVDLSDGVGIESLAMLLPGRYTAQLSIANRRIGIPVSFTVAEYTLAPLSARLISHRLKREKDQLWFELAVESYQKPFADELIVTLVERGKEVALIGLLPLSPGRYAGGVKILGEGPFRLRLMAANDAERVAEVAIPGSRAVERQVSVISELGREMLFSMMSEANALPLRGGYLSEGELIGTPLTVESIITNRRQIQVNANVESVVLVNLDLTTGNYSVQKVGNVATGDTITAMINSPFCTIFVGGLLYGQPFEGYTIFISLSSFLLSVDAPKTILPRSDLVVRLSCDGLKEKTIPVLLCVRDERLTATDKPEVSLGAAAKRGIDAATEGMDERAFSPLNEFTLQSFVVENEYEESSGLYDSESYDQFMVDETKRFDIETEVLPPLDEALKLSQEDNALTPKTPPKKAAITDSPRAEFPEVLFYDIVPITGSKEIAIPLSDSLGTFTVETFAMTEGDWTQNKTTVVVDKPVRIDLELPPAVHPDDKVIGRLRAITSSRKAQISLTLNGKTVALRNGKPIDALSTDTPVEVEFYIKSGTYFAKVEDSETGETDSIELVVGEPGKFKSYAKELGLLFKDDTISLETANALSMRVIPNIDTSFDSLVTATAGYSYLCCEQTAAKILAAIFMYLTAKNKGQRNAAEQIILAGIAREQKMIRPGQGFAMYPNDSYISKYYSKLAVRYLWKLDQLDEIPDISKKLHQAVREGLSLADKAAKAHKMQRIPDKIIQSIEEAYTLAILDKKYSEISQFLENVIDLSGSVPGLKKRQHAVADRQKLAYAAACLIVRGDFRNGIKLANQVTRQFNEQGRLYSTEDSVAAIALMIQLRKSGIVTGKARLRVNGQEMTATEAAQLNDPIESIEVLESVAAVEVTRLHEEDWGHFANNFPVKIGLRNTKNQAIQQVRANERLEMVITLPKGYQAGDLAHVALPACLSWIQGGGKVKLFSLDFEGKNELRIPLLVTSQIEGKQHFAVCVRNMFKEERASSPGLLTIEG